MIRVEDVDSKQSVEEPLIKKAKSIRKKKKRVPKKSYTEAKEFWETKVKCIARNTNDIKKSLVLKPSTDDSDAISLVSEEESMEFQPCYSYHSMTDDEEAYISGKNNKI